MDFANILIIFLVLLFVAEQVAIKLHMPYPYRHGFIIYRTNVDIPKVSDIKSIKSAELNIFKSLKRFISPLRFYNYDENEIYFYRAYVKVNLFEPAIYAGQVITKSDGNSALFIRVGYCTLTLYVAILIYILVKYGILACAGATLLSIFTLSSFLASFNSYVQRQSP